MKYLALHKPRPLTMTTLQLIRDHFKSFHLEKCDGISIETGDTDTLESWTETRNIYNCSSILVCLKEKSLKLELALEWASLILCVVSYE